MSTIPKIENNIPLFQGQLYEAGSGSLLDALKNLKDRKDRIDPSDERLCMPVSYEEYQLWLKILGSSSKVDL